MVVYFLLGSRLTLFCKACLGSGLQSHHDDDMDGGGGGRFFSIVKIQST
jgi:hypothetical protein